MKKGSRVNLRTHYRPRALKLCQQLKCTWRLIEDAREYDPQIEVFAPAGFRFLQEECGSYLCYDWKDVIERLESCELKAAEEVV